MRKASRRLTLRADRSDFFDCAEYGGQLMRTHGRVATGKSVLVLATEYGAPQYVAACCLDADAGGGYDRRHDDGGSFPTPIYL
jgi:hypothetical protein